MRKKTEDYMGAVANAYIILIAAVLPLYMEDGLTMIGDAKYIFFIKYSLLILVFSGAGLLVRLAVPRKEKQNFRWSVTDSFAVFYSLAVLLSYLFSDYRQDALFGYPDWHMGLVTQLLFVWIYFFLSRWYGGEKYIWWIVSIAAFGVFLLGVINRYCYDPLGNFAAVDHWDWNRLNLLSTIGNINWYCGYLCVMFPALLYFFWGGSVRYIRILGGLGSFIGFVTLYTQGSASGYAGVGAALLVLFLFSLSSVKRLRRFLGIVLTASLVPVLIAVTLPWAPAGLSLPQDGTEEILFWKGWYAAALISGILFFLCLLWEKRWNGGTIRKTVRWGAAAAVAALLVLGAVCVVLCQLSPGFFELLGSPSALKIHSQWGSGRGGLWQLSLRCFLEGDWKQKLLGAGPDCFAGVIYSMFDVESIVSLKGQWEGAVFANAHNEWLNMLVTGGVTGSVTYLGIFLSAAVRFRKRAAQFPLLIMGVMMIAGYCCNDIFSFQQSVSTPVMFVMLGIMESRAASDFF